MEPAAQESPHNTIEIVDLDDDSPVSVANATTHEPVSANGFQPLAPSTTKLLHATNHGRDSHAEISCGPSALGQKRKRAQSEHDDDEVQIISAFPTTKNSRERGKDRIQASSTASDRYQRNEMAVDEVIDLDLLPDIRPRSTDRSSRPGSRSLATLPLVAGRPREYGSATEPIDLENYIDGGEGPSRSQLVNGNPVGTFQNGRYIPYRPLTPPYIVPNLPDDGRRDVSAPGSLYDWDRDVNGQRLIEVFRQQRSIQHAQGHIPLPASSYGINAQSRQAVPMDFTSERSRYYSQYQQAFEQNQISAEDLNNLLANISDKDIPPDQRVANPVGLTKFLMEHQRVGLTWLISTENGTNKGGILADAMGYVIRRLNALILMI